MPKEPAISRINVMRIAAHCGCDTRTVRAYFDRTKLIKHATAFALRAALRELGISGPRESQGLSHVGAGQ